MSCSSASAETPMASASLARGLSSDVKSSVSSGSISFRRNLPSVTRKGLASLRAVLISFFISLLLIFSPLPFYLIFLVPDLLTQKNYAFVPPLLRFSGCSRRRAELSIPQYDLALAREIDRLAKNPRGFLRRVEAGRVFGFDEIQIELGLALEVLRRREFIVGLARCLRP